MTKNSPFKVRQEKKEKETERTEYRKDHGKVIDYYPGESIFTPEVDAQASHFKCGHYQIPFSKKTYQQERI